MNTTDLNRSRALFRLMRNPGASPHEQIRAMEALARLCRKHRITLDAFEERYMIRVARFITQTYVEGICAAIVAVVYNLDGTKLPMHPGAEIVYRGPPETVRAAERLRRRLLAVRLPRVIVNNGDGTETDISTTDAYRLGFFADLYRDVVTERAKNAPKPPPFTSAPATHRDHTTAPPPDERMPPPDERMPDPDAPDETPNASPERPSEAARSASPGDGAPPVPKPYNLDGAVRGYSRLVDRLRVLQEAMAAISPVPESRRIVAPPRPRPTYYSWGA